MGDNEDRSEAERLSDVRPKPRRTPRQRQRVTRIPGMALVLCGTNRCASAEVQTGSCQNCVTCPPKPPSNTVVYGATPMHIVVAGSR